MVFPLVPDERQPEMHSNNMLPAAITQNKNKLFPLNIYIYIYIHTMKLENGTFI